MTIREDVNAGSLSYGRPGYLFSFVVASAIAKAFLKRKNLTRASRKEYNELLLRQAKTKTHKKGHTEKMDIDSCRCTKAQKTSSYTPSMAPTR